MNILYFQWRYTNCQCYRSWSSRSGMSRYRQRVSSNIMWFTCLFYYIFYFWFWFEPIKLAEPWQFVLRCLYQSRKMRIMYLYVRGIDVASFWDFSVGFWNCSELWYFVFSILLVECLDYRQRVSWQFTWHKFCSVAAMIIPVFQQVLVVLSSRAEGLYLSYSCVMLSTEIKAYLLLSILLIANHIFTGCVVIVRWRG